MKGHILLVDDNEAFLDSTKDVLEEEGYHVTTASTGEHAIRYVEVQDFDVVIMDIKMPGVNGVEAFVKMKKHKPGIRVIMCTAYIVESLIRKALAEGARAVLNKPFEIDLLLRTIGQVLSERRRGGRILIADREPDLCEELRREFTSAGYHVVVVHDGSAALKQTQESRFDILIFEADLPLIHGLELYHMIKAVQPDVLATIIMGRSGELITEVKRRATAEKGLTSLTKPLDTVQLRELLDSIYEAGCQETITVHRASPPGRGVPAESGKGKGWPNCRETS